MIIGIAGPAGSGKNTVAEFISKYSKTVEIAQADPMKRFAATVFGFTEEQLWGPSECRNGVDERYLTSPAWTDAAVKLHAFGYDWVAEVLPSLVGYRHNDAFKALTQWFYDLAREHGFERAVVGSGVDMKPTLESLFPATRPRKLTPRYVLQTLGTEWGRQFSPDMWNDYAIRVARKLLCGGPRYDRAKGLSEDVGYHGPEFVVITDIRFRNEVFGVNISNGIVINVDSPTKDNSAVEAAGMKSHRSETELEGIPKHWFYGTLINDKSWGLLALENRVANIVKDLRQHRLI